jgi:nucleoside phosphorylase
VDALVALGARPVRVATTLAVTEADDLAAALVTTLSCEAEHLEAAGVAEACVQARVPFAAVLGVANRVGAPARAQWRAHHREAGDAAARLAERWLVDGAAGLVRN